MAFDNKRRKVIEIDEENSVNSDDLSSELDDSENIDDSDVSSSDDISVDCDDTKSTNSSFSDEIDTSSEIEDEISRIEIDGKNLPSNQFESYSGSCHVFYESGAEYVGFFVKGQRHGSGCLTTDSCMMQGNFLRNELEGIGSFETDCSLFEGEMHKSLPHGFGIEKEDGMLMYEGEFAKGERFGKGTAHLGHGLKLQGRFVKGVLHDRRGRLNYNDGWQMEGRWKEGRFVRGRFVKRQETESKSDHLIRFYERARLRLGCVPRGYDTFCEWEADRVCVAPSLMGEKSGDGLFAIRDMKKDDLICYYGGVFLTHDVVDNRDWEDNSNTHSLNKRWVLDVPTSIIKSWKITLGHKVNHAFLPMYSRDLMSTFDSSSSDESSSEKAIEKYLEATFEIPSTHLEDVQKKGIRLMTLKPGLNPVCCLRRNAKYDLAYHPQFGIIRCVVAIRDIKAGEEVFVNYLYGLASTGENESLESNHVKKNEEGDYCYEGSNVKGSQLEAPSWFQDSWDVVQSTFF
eukprot:GDKK01072180.1.p1 GENE.GDKK01072180.1~~GDKK01072180.1.p1  ORF type:complete len:514 (+),score=102.40 GDKK01072180.1:2-1543(+)